MLGSNERYYPATPDETFAALVSAVREQHKFKSADGFSRAVTFSTYVSGFSWGAQMSAYVMPERDGCIVRVGGRANVRANLTAGGAEHRNAAQLLDRVGEWIRWTRDEWAREQQAKTSQGGTA